MPAVQGGHELGLAPAPVLLPDSPADASPADLFGAPATFDLRTSGRVSPVKNQGAFGTCWTFATFGSLESSWLLGTLYDFSEDNVARTVGLRLQPLQRRRHLHDVDGVSGARRGPVLEIGRPVRRHASRRPGSSPAPVCGRADHLNDDARPEVPGRATSPRSRTGSTGPAPSTRPCSGRARTTRRRRPCYYGGASYYCRRAPATP